MKQIGLTLMVVLVSVLAACRAGPTIPPEPTATAGSPILGVTPSPTITPISLPTTPTLSPNFTLAPSLTPTSGVPAGQIVFGAYPCGPDGDCNPYPGMENHFGIYIISSDGTGMRPITGDELLERGLLFHLPFVPNEMVKRAEEEEHFQRYINALQGFTYELIQWLPDGSAWIEPGQDGLYLVQIDGTGATQPVEGRIFCYDSSPDGEHIAYAEGTAIYVMSLDNFSRLELIEIPAREVTDMRWSQSGEWILVSATQGPSVLCPTDLYLINVNSQQIQHLFSLPEGCLLNPQWSQEDHHVTFVACDRAQEYLNMLLDFSLDSNQEAQLAQVTGLNGCIGHRTWSPEHTALAFSLAPGPWRIGGLNILDLESGHYWEILSSYVPVGPLVWLEL